MGIPTEVLSVLQLHPLLQDLVLEVAEPECQAQLDNFSGPRCHDLLIRGWRGDDQLVIGVEGKTDETFGPTLAQALATPPPSRRPERVAALTKAVFGPVDLTTVGHLRYQLLHGLAGTLVSAAAHEAAVAIFLIHEFRLDGTSIRKLDENQRDLDRFLRQLPATDRNQGSPGFVVGPFTVRGYDCREIFIAKAAYVGSYN
jgi:hypothetical protein